MTEKNYFAIGRKNKNPLNSNHAKIDFITESNKILVFKNESTANEYFDKYDKNNQNINIEFIKVKIDINKFSETSVKIIE